MPYSDRLFRNFLLLSIFIHAFILIGLPRLRVMPFRRMNSKLEVTYQNIKAETSVKKRLLEMIEKRLSVNSGLKPTADLKKIPNPPAYSQDVLRSGGRTTGKKISTPAIKEKTLSSFVKLPNVTSPFTKSPAYINYYEVIREKIKAVVDLSTSFSVEGEVYLTFIVDSNGQLKALKLIEDKSIVDQELRQIAYNYVEQASPFPPFPKELKHPQLSFNVIIEFRLSE